MFERVEESGNISKGRGKGGMCERVGKRRCLNGCGKGGTFERVEQFGVGGGVSNGE